MAAKFTSIRYPLSVDAGLGRIQHEDRYAKHVEQMMLQVLMTSPGERINRPDFGWGVKRMVFAPNSKVTAALAQVSVFQALEKWLGTLISVNNVTVEALEEKLEIKISYVLKARQEKRYLNLEVTV